MTDVTGIANIALVELGKKPITELGEGSEQADVLQSNYEQVRDLVLRMHPWNSAIFRKVVAADQYAPAFGYAARYAMPTDPYCLRALEVNGNNYQWKVEGRWILTDITPSINLRFIGLPSSVQEFDPMLVNAIGLALAARCAQRLVNSKTKQREALEKFKDALKDARSTDGQEGLPDELPESEILLSRLVDDV